MSRDIKYIGMDVHKEATVIAVLNGSGKLVMESIVETKASSIVQFIHGLRGELHVTWEEGTWASWLHDLLLPQVTQVLVCNPRRNALLKEGSKSDKIDARKLADLLRTGMLAVVQLCILGGFFFRSPYSRHQFSIGSECHPTIGRKFVNHLRNATVRHFTTTNAFARPKLRSRKRQVQQ